MKHKILSLVTAIALLTASCGTTYKSTSTNAAYNVEVPTNIRSSFSANYPDAAAVVWNRYDPNTVPIDWEMAGWPALTTNDYAVNFNMGNNTYYAWYDANGNLIGSSYTVSDPSRLPPAITRYIQEKYSAYTIKKMQTETKNNVMAYEIKLEQGDNKVKLLIDANGTVLKEKLKD
jgi:hypothetical protein